MSKKDGFTLIEVMLVLVIATMMIIMGINYMQQQSLAARVTKTSLQMQQILNAGLAFYVMNGKWPNDIANDLQGNNFLPPTQIINPWGNQYGIATGPNTGPPSSPTAPALFYVYTDVIGSASTSSAYAAATMIAGKLPLAYTTSTKPPTGGGVPDPTTPCTTSTTDCYIAASVNIPGQNLNNAAAVNFAGVYNNGACIPAPNCPLDSGGNTMTAQVFLVPVSVSGLSDPSDLTHVYPINSFTAFPAPTGTSSAPVAKPDACPNATMATPVDCTQSTGYQPGALYWRACLDIVTEKGRVPGVDSQWGSKVSMAAFTRCSIKNEPSGSPFGMFSN